MCDPISGGEYSLVRSREGIFATTMALVYVRTLNALLRKSTYDVYKLIKLGCSVAACGWRDK